VFDLPEQAGECFVSLKDGVVSIRHAEEGPYPVIVPCEGVVMTVDEVVWAHEVPVRIGDNVKISPILDERLGSWSLAVSPDGLTATVRVLPSVRVTRSLPDLPPSPRLKLQVLEEVERFSPVQLDTLMSALRQEGVRVGVDLKILPEIVAATEDREFIIARGQPPLAGRDAEAVILFEQNDRTEREVRPDSTVDHRSRFDYHSVREGQVLVRKVPRVMGQDGASVRGETIFAKEPADMDLIAGDGVRLHEESLRLIAVSSGRPMVKKRQRGLRVDIRPDMTVAGDVDLRSGNVSFVGDVTVQGDVTAGFALWAGGIIKVRGLAENSHLQACAAVEVQGNIISSQVFVGPPPGLLRTFNPMLRELDRDISTVQLAIEQLKKRIPANKQSFAGRLVSTLIEQRLVGFDERVKALLLALHKLDRRLHDFFGANVMTILAKFLEDASSGTKTEGHLADLQGALGTLQARLEELSSQNAHIKVRNVINSTLISTGDISVVNGGCYNSWLQAGGKVTVQGVVRGGEIRAGADVVVKELGSESGATTQIHVPSSAKVFLGIAWEHSGVIVGSRMHRFERKQSGVVIFLEGNALVVK